MFLNIKIKEARIEKKMTQQQLADELTKLNRKTSNTAIANWESGLNSPDVETLQLICKILDKDGNYFFDFSNSNNLNEKYKIEVKQNYGPYSLQLLDDYNKLNTLGKQKANENVRDLTKIDEYTERKNESQQA